MVHIDSNQQSLLEARQVAKWRKDRWVFKSVDLQLNSGECVGLFGPSGCGKTTILRGLLGFESFDEGEVWVNGKRKSTEMLQDPAVRREFGYVMQSNNLWPYRTALDNVAEGLRFGLHRSVKESREVAHNWLKRLGIASHAHKFPGELSGGERQRVAIARALAMNPRALLLDEPTSGLDPLAAGELSELLLSLRSQGGSFLIVSHQIDLLRRMSDRVYFLSNGRVIESGPARDVLMHPETRELTEFIAKVRMGW